MPSLQTRRQKSLGKSQRSFKKGFRQSIRKARSAQPYTNITAEKIGEGGFGTVSRPPARCNKFFSSSSKNINDYNWNSIVFQETYYKNPNYISKLSDYNAAIKEMNIGNIIKHHIKNWEKYYCFTEFICEAPKEKHVQIGPDEFQDTYGIAPYCGITLNKIIQGKYHIAEKELCCLLNALKGLCIGLGKLHNIQIYHNDIHDENILFNPKDGKLRWIDFGLAEDLVDEKKALGKNWESKPIFIKHKLEDTESLIFNIISPTLQHIKYKLKKSKESKLIQKCLDTVTSYLHKIPYELKNYINSSNHYKHQSVQELINIRNTYIDFIGDFIENYDETKKCEWMTKN
jgi:serine/threonine protein kinase